MSNGASYDVRQKAVEVGYILKKELDIVIGIEQMSSATNRGSRNIDMQGLINDNVQLFHEKQKLLQENMRLNEILQSRITTIASKLYNLSGEISLVNQTVSSLR
jgi:hypothetical protein